MGMDNVQLKQEDILNDNVVLSDINPITNTNSVDDSASGEKLNETLSRLWNAINNKLTRIVNSVNGRTGVVVLSPEDVGLGDVDNVSFAEIKQWVIDQIKNEFVNRSLKLYESLADVDEVCLTNDQSYIGAPFFCDITNANDRRSCIGCYIWDTDTSSLGYIQHPINTVGYADNSIIYNEEVNNTDLRGGGIGVNIHPDEEALQLFNGPSKADSGLRIDGSKITGKIYFFNCLYGVPTTASDDNPTHPSSGRNPAPPKTDSMLLSCQDESNGAVVHIYLNGTEITDPRGIYLDRTSNVRLKPGDVIVTNFGWYGFIDAALPLHVPYYNASTNLMARQPAIGYVETVPNDFMVDAPYVIRFTTIKPTVGFGIRYRQTHVLDDTLRDNIIIPDINVFNISGMNATDKDTPNVYHTDLEEGNDMMLYTQTPWSPMELHGLGITSDVSISSYQLNDLAPSGLQYVGEDGVVRYKGSNCCKNYAYDPEKKFTQNLCTYRSTADSFDAGIVAPESRLSVNLNRAIKRETQTRDSVYFYNLSGLKFAEYDPDSRDQHSEKSIEDILPKLGMLDGLNTDGIIPDYIPYSGESGGLQINIGKFLEICPKRTVSAVDYDKGGKLQVRIGRGLKEDVEYWMIESEPADWITNIDSYVTTETDDYPNIDIHPELIIPIPEIFELTQAEPDNWRDLYQSYYDDQYEHIPEGPVYYRLNDGLTAPSWYAEPYYERFWDETSQEYEYRQVNYKPDNWNVTSPDVPNTYKSYYVKRTQAPIWEPNKYYLHRHQTFAEVVASDRDVFKIVSTNRIVVDESKLTLRTYFAEYSYKQKQILYSEGKVYLVVQDFTATTLADDITSGYLIDISGGSEIATALTQLTERVGLLEQRIVALEQH